MSSRPRLFRRLIPSFSSIRTRILLITISFMFFFSILASYVSCSMIYENIRRTMIQNSGNQLSFLCSSVENTLNNVNVFIRSCRTNKSVNAFVSGSDPDAKHSRIKAHETVSELYLSNSFLPSQLVRMIILRKSENDFIQIVQNSYSSASVSADRLLALPFFELLHEYPGTAAVGIINDPFLPHTAAPVIPLVYPIQHPYSAAETGYIYAELPASIITDPMNDSTTGTDSYFCFRMGSQEYQYHEESRRFIPMDTEYIIGRDLSGVSLDSETSAAIVTHPQSHQRYLCVTRPIDGVNWSISEYIPSSLLLRKMAPLLFWILPGILVSISILGIGLLMLLHHIIEVPVHLLLTRMERIREGDFSRDPDTEWNHEIGEIGKTINDLSEHVLSLMNQRIADEKEKKDYEYKMLQSQINPHFLYNTLNSIKWMATVQCAPGIAEMTTSLSRLLKDISKGTTNLVTIDHDLNLIRDYFVIQQYRYGGTITMDIEVDDDELLSCAILKFTLQPLVENAIFHGIEPKGTTGHIHIHIFEAAEDLLQIDVTDDGIGIDPERARTLLAAPKEKSSSSFFREIGIHNVHKRLKYEFGEQYGLSIESIPGEYTTISVLLPNQKITEQPEYITGVPS